mgnify:CR=1 FL=1
MRASASASTTPSVNPLTLNFDLSVNGDKAAAKGFATLDRTVFGVGQGEYAATDSIPAAVKVTFSISATRKTGH